MIRRYRTEATYGVATFESVSSRGAQALMPQGLGSAVITLFPVPCNTGRARR